MEGLLEKHLQEIIDLYFDGCSISEALEAVKNERELDGTGSSNNERRLFS